MTDNVTLTRDQVSDMLKALNGISNLLKGLTPRSGNSAELYAVMSNIAVIQTALIGNASASAN